MHMNTAFIAQASATERHCNTIRLPIREITVKNLILQ